MTTINSSAIASSAESAIRSTPAIDLSTDDHRQSRLLAAMKVQYQADQQAKFLHLQEETDSLLQQLKAIKLQREGFAELELAQAATR